MKIKIILLFVCITLRIFSQNEGKRDSLIHSERLSVQVDWKSIYYGNVYMLRGSNFVRKIELKYNINGRWRVGMTTFWGWRFGKNFGEDIGYSINERKKAIETAYDDKPYSLDEWFNDRILDKTYYALNYKYRGYGLFVEYQLDKNGIGKIFKRKLHWVSYLGTSYVTGEVAGKLLYVYKQPSRYLSKSDYEYFFIYEKINYVNISLDLKLRLQLEAKPKDWILPGFSIYYVYAPDQARNGMKNFGWMWDIRFILWKK
ncbi:MAG: hypothetical protein KatS3mg027_0502 [Bacteroidia bacterium]|nr:MAG: hypothetical protein KatS3mg027_0502 [Bacteroidia bacterium]